MAGLDWLMRLGPRALQLRGKQRLSILIYHRVLAEPDPLRPGEPTVEEFERQMRLLSEYFHPLPLCEAAQRLRDRALPERPVCVTFDDGYADNEQLAMPVLLKLGIPATIFISTGFLNGGRMFNDTVIETVRRARGDRLDLGDLGLASWPLERVEDRLRAIDGVLTSIKHRDPGERASLAGEIERLAEDLPRNLMMTDEQVRNLTRNGIDVGAHTVNHPILTSVDDETARVEIAGSKRVLENLLQTDVQAFAYPNGKPAQDYDARHRDMVAGMGFRVAVSTHWGVGLPESDCFQLPRFTPWDRDSTRFALRLLLNARRVDPLLAA